MILFKLSMVVLVVAGVAVFLHQALAPLRAALGG